MASEFIQRQKNDFFRDITSLGSLLSDGKDQMTTAPWMLFAPSVTMLITLLALNFLGDGLRDALDPKER